MSDRWTSEDQGRATATDVLIVGAGPFGIAVAAHVKALGLDFTVLGRPMESWTRQMPRGMFLRSGCDWHLDTRGVHTIARYVELLGRTPAAVEPLSRDFYLDYVAWFMEQKGLAPDPTYVVRLDHRPSEGLPFQATLEDGRAIQARRAVIALGFAHCRFLPPEVVARLPAGRYVHTWDFVDFGGVGGQRFLIVGGRQSAFEWAALLRESGAASVDVAYRSATPPFATADWTWVDPLVAAMVDNPGWFRQLSQGEKDHVSRRMWAEGRLKMEPWLARRVLRDGITLHPQASVVGSEVEPDGAIAVRLDDGGRLAVDQVVLATGYRPQLAAVPFLAAGNILADLPVRNGCPVLDEHFQTDLPSLFVTSFAATQDFGPFFAFTVSARTSAELIGRALRSGSTRDRAAA